MELVFPFLSASPDLPPLRFPIHWPQVAAQEQQAIESTYKQLYKKSDS